MSKDAQGGRFINGAWVHAHFLTHAARTRAYMPQTLPCAAAGAPVQHAQAAWELTGAPCMLPFSPVNSSASAHTPDITTPNTHTYTTKPTHTETVIGFAGSTRTGRTTAVGSELDIPQVRTVCAAPLCAVRWRSSVLCMLRS